MKVFGWASFGFGVLFLIMGVGYISGNPSLHMGGPRYMPFQEYWRYLIGTLLWIASLLFVVAYIAAKNLPGLAWLSLILHLILYPVFAIGLGIIPGFNFQGVFSLVIAAVGTAVFVFGFAALGAVIASAIGRSARRAKERRQQVPPSLPYRMNLPSPPR